MKKVTIEVYKLDELNEEAKEKAIKDHKIFLSEFCDDEHIIDHWQEDFLPELGFNSPRISYSGFWSQGDGASFETSDIDITKLLNKEERKKYKEIIDLCNEFLVTFSLDRINSHYSHKFTCKAYDDINPSIDLTEKQEKMIDEILEIITKTYHDLADKLYTELEENYDYITSDENAIESIKTNDYDFTSDGSIWS